MSLQMLTYPKKDIICLQVKLDNHMKKIVNEAINIFVKPCLSLKKLGKFEIISKDLKTEAQIQA